jgi:hypothetical protein
MRILRPGGILRLTECDRSSNTTSVSFETMQDILSVHSYEAGRTFQRVDWGVTCRLSRFLRNVDCKNVQVHAYAIDWSMGMPAWSIVRQDFEMAYKLMQSYLVNVGATTNEEWNNLWEQSQREFYETEFNALWYFVSAWGQKAV